MYKIIIVMLLAVISSISAEPFQQYSLNEKIWFPSEPYRQDIKNRLVNIIINKGNTVNCNAANEYSHWFFNQTEKKYAYGELCNELFVFLQAPLNSDHAKIAIPHESFHLLAQLKTMKIPYAFAPNQHSEESVNFVVMDPFFKFVMSAKNKNTASNCKEFDAITGRLSADELNFMKWRMFIEWPAVFYTMLESYGEDKIEVFYDDRRKISNKSLLLYISAIEGIKLIESKFERGDWQTMLYEGSSLFDMYKYSLGCTNKIYQHQSFLTDFMPILEVEKPVLIDKNLIEKEVQSREICGKQDHAEAAKLLSKVCGNDSNSIVELILTEKKKLLSCQFEEGNKLIVDCVNKQISKESNVR